MSFYWYVVPPKELKTKIKLPYTCEMHAYVQEGGLWLLTIEHGFGPWMLDIRDSNGVTWKGGYIDLQTFNEEEAKAKAILIYAARD